MEIRIDPYSADLEQAWDGFVDESKNGTFLFRRGYMDYHDDRYQDSSLLFFGPDEGVLALLPANREGPRVVSHGGLTYGGLVTGHDMRLGTMLGLFDQLLQHLAGEGVEALEYRAVPHIYHRSPAEEDLYAIHRRDGRLVRRAASSTLYMAQRPPVQERRRRGVKRASSAGVDYRPNADVDGFLDLVATVLDARHGARPVHTAAELRHLMELFPQNISLYTAEIDGSVVAGTVVYRTETVAHLQYIASSDEGLGIGALDGLVSWLLSDVFGDVRFFDFGTSMRGEALNDGLIENKEGWGARTTLYDTYEVSAG